MIKKSMVPVMLLALLIVQSLTAQNMSKLVVSGKASIAESELISKENKDSNGDVCAGLFIISDLEGLTYDSYNKIVKTTSKPGQDLLFLSPSEQVVTVYKSGYEPLKLILNELGVRLESGKVWQIRVTAEGNIPINIVTTPANAQIEIDGTLKPAGPTQMVTLGKHAVRISRTGYKTINDTINVTSSRTLFTYILELIKLQKITVKSMPEGAAVRLDEIEKGVTDLQFFNLPGKYKLKLSKPGYFDFEKEIEIFETAENQFSFTLIKNAVALKISVTPPDAEVHINGQKVKAPGTVELPEGSVFLEVSGEGYETHTETISLIRNNPVQRKIDLKPIYGAVELLVKPLDANIILKRNDKTLYRWKGSVQKDSLLTGSYIAEISYPGYEKLRKELSVHKNEILKESFALNPAVGAGIYINSVASDDSFIENLKGEETGGQYIISFDLNGEPEKEYEIELFLKDSKNPAFEVKLNKLTGDFNVGKYTGRGRKITWNFREEFKGGLDNSNLFIKLKADKLSGGIPWYYYVGGALVGGVVAVLVSGGKSGDSSVPASLPNPPGRPGN